MSIDIGLEPKQVFRFFEEISAIPRGSGNTRAISDYCVKFAKDRGLDWQQYADHNVIIKKEATEGYSKSAPVILQGHLDMVCEHDEGIEMDFRTGHLALYVDGDFLKARGTTLGGDDGIAVAYFLAVLDSKDLEHPPLEVVFTVDEEVGLLGAKSLDVSLLTGKRLLNLDSVEEGVFLTGCAGGVRVECMIPVSYKNKKAKNGRYELKVHGLQGGHSGAEIHHERANAILVMGRILKVLYERFDIKIEALEGGMKDNAIPRESSAILHMKTSRKEDVAQLVGELEKVLKNEYRISDPGIELVFQEMKNKEAKVLNRASTEQALFLLRNFPGGVMNRSAETPELVETSINPGTLELGTTHLFLTCSIRSSVTTRKYDLLDRIRLLARFLGGTVNASADYPAWEDNPDSPLRALMAKTYEDLFGKPAKFETIHAGLECAVLSEKMEGLDCISFGPDNLDIHTPHERLSISSTERVWKLLVEFLKRAR